MVDRLLVGSGYQFKLIEALILFLLLSDVATDYLGIAVYGIHKVTARPQLLPCVVAFPLEKMPGHVDGALAFDEANHTGNRHLGRNADQHVNMIGKDMPLLNLTLLLLR